MTTQIEGYTLDIQNGILRVYDGYGKIIAYGRSNDLTGDTKTAIETFINDNKAYHYKLSNLSSKNAKQFIIDFNSRFNKGEFSYAYYSMNVCVQCFENEKQWIGNYFLNKNIEVNL